VSRKATGSIPRHPAAAIASSRRRCTRARQRGRCQTQSAPRSGTPVDGGIAPLVDHRGEEEQIGRGIGARQLVLVERAGAAQRRSELGFEARAFRSFAGAKQLQPHPGAPHPLDDRGEQRHILAGVELAGIHRHEMTRRQRKPPLKPGPVAPLRGKQRAVEAAAQRNPAMPVTGLGGYAKIGRHRGRAGQVPGEPALQQGIDPPRQPENIVRRTIGEAPAELAFEQLGGGDAGVFGRVGVDRADQRDAVAAGKARRRPGVAEKRVGGMDDVVIGQGPRESRMPRRQIGMVRHFADEAPGAQYRRQQHVAHR